MILGDRIVLQDIDNYRPAQFSFGKLSSIAKNSYSIVDEKSSRSTFIAGFGSGKRKLGGSVPAGKSVSGGPPLPSAVASVAAGPTQRQGPSVPEPAGPHYT